MGHLRKFLGLTATEKYLFLEAFFLVATVRALLWLVPSSLLQHLLRTVFSPHTVSADVDWERISQITRRVQAASRYVPRATCLTQAIAASLLIRSSGQDAELKIGVTKAGQSRLLAHAWLEKNGRIILGELPDQGRFVALKAYSV